MSFPKSILDFLQVHIIHSLQEYAISRHPSRKYATQMKYTWAQGTHTGFNSLKHSEEICVSRCKCLLLSSISIFFFPTDGNNCKNQGRPEAFSFHDTSLLCVSTQNNYFNSQFYFFFFSKFSKTSFRIPAHFSMVTPQLTEIYRDAGIMC